MTPLKTLLIMIALFLIAFMASTMITKTTAQYYFFI